MEGLILVVAVISLVLVALTAVGAVVALLGLRWTIETIDQRVQSLEDTRKANARADALDQLSGRTRPRRPV